MCKLWNPLLSQECAQIAYGQMPVPEKNQQGLRALHGPSLIVGGIASANLLNAVGNYITEL